MHTYPHYAQIIAYLIVIIYIKNIFQTDKKISYLSFTLHTNIAISVENVKIEMQTFTEKENQPCAHQNC